MLKLAQFALQAMSPIQYLEAYSRQHPEEVLLVNACWDDPDSQTAQDDYVMVFKGFSSSLMYATAADPDLPIVPEQAEIVSIDRLKSPYDPNCPQYLSQNMAWDEFVRVYLKEIESV